MIKSVFVYGTLKPGLRNYYPLCKFVNNNFISNDNCYIEGYKLYHLTPENYPAIIQDSNNSKKVYGWLFDFGDIDHALEFLDDLEGIMMPDPLYTRTVTTVKPINKKAYVYLGNDINRYLNNIRANVVTDGIWRPQNIPIKYIESLTVLVLKYNNGIDNGIKMSDIFINLLESIGIKNTDRKVIIRMNNNSSDICLTIDEYHKEIFNTKLQELKSQHIVPVGNTFLTSEQVQSIYMDTIASGKYATCDYYGDQLFDINVVWEEVYQEVTSTMEISDTDDRQAFLLYLPQLHRITQSQNNYDIDKGRLAAQLFFPLK